MNDQNKGQANDPDWDRLIEKAWKDPQFKQDLLAHPAEVLNRELENGLPEGIEIRVMEDTANTVNFVLPMSPDQFAAIEIDQKELEVSGYAPSNTDVRSGCPCCGSGRPAFRLRGQFGAPGLPGLPGLPGRGGIPTGPSPSPLTRGSRTTRRGR